MFYSRSFSLLSLMLLLTSLCFPPKYYSQKEKVIKLDSLCIFFEVGKSNVDNIDQISARLGALPFETKVKIVLNGYTDSTGSIELNVLLAKNRLENVQAKIQENSFFDLKFVTKNMNEKRITKKGNTDNFRRVDVLIYEIIEPELDIPSTAGLFFELEEVVELKINFEPGTAILLSSSFSELEKLQSTLSSDLKLKIDLHGHVCCEDDQPLSLKRANMVKDYLVSKGIKSARIKCIGFSNRSPKIPEMSEEDQAENRRVEVIFSKMK